ncbi:RidA family protein [Devosia sp. 2618]|uniref:RidA family protein n=1 Tax=Devosia sp. 2618 TaxID=3156454 RepID=UPI0033947299
MSRALRHLIKGLIIMTIASSAASANELNINPPGLFDPTAFGYSQVVIAPGGSRIAYISGQGGAGSDRVLSPDFATQVAQAYANLGVALDGVGAKPNQVIKLTVYVVDHDPSKLGVLTEQVVKMFGAALPAQTLVPVPRLALDGMLFEVDAVVVVE